MLFDKRQTNISKGIGLMMLLWCHLFINTNDLPEFTSLFIYNSVPIETKLVSISNICVAVFLLLSGYGMYKSYQTFIENIRTEKDITLFSEAFFVIKHLIKLLSGFWFIFLVFVPIGLFLGKLPYSNLLYIIEDFFGISYLCGGITLNVTWWYMGITILFYVLFPIVYKLFDYSSHITLLLSFLLILLPAIPLKIKNNAFVFVFGMYIAKYNGFEKLKSKFNTKTKTLVFCILILVVITHIYLLLPLEAKEFMAFVTIFISFVILSKIKILNKLLFELGKYSGSIYMFHAFIYYYYFKDVIYSMKYSILMFIVLTVLCYLIARLFEWIKHIIHYDSFFNNTILWIEKKMLK